MYTLDTNAIIYYLNDDPAAVGVLEPIFSQDVALYLSAITELELFSFPGLTDEEVTAIEAILTSVVIIPVDSRLARLGGYLRRQYRLKTADVTIAATALLTHTTLITRNVRDFQQVDTLSLMPI